MIREAVVLASGFGRRLRKLTGSVPKVFYKVMGMELVKYPMLSLMEAGVERFIVVVPEGFKALGYKVLHDLGVEGTVVENDRISLGNAYSFMVTEKYTGDVFFLSCGDSLYTGDAARKMVKDPDFAHIKLAVSRVDEYIDPDEASKVLLNERGKILNIGKGIQDYTHYDTGLFVMTKEVYKLKGKMEWNREISLFHVLQKAIDEGMEVKGVDLGEEPWTEVDTVEDLEMVLKGKGASILAAITEGSRWKAKARMASCRDI